MSNDDRQAAHQRTAIEELIASYRVGRMDRRAFVQSLLGFGMTAAVAQSVATLWCNDAHAQSTKAVDPPAQAFDYIVVGAGSGGATLASRLARETDASVLVLESGGEDDIPEIHDPRGWGAALGTRAAKYFSTEPQRNTSGRVHVWPRGNAIGGTSNINAMIFCRGHRSDFDSWAYAGNTGWDYASVLPLFKAFEDWEGGANAWRGAGGPLHVSQPRGDRRHEGAVAFMAACRDLGYRATADFNGARMEGPAWVNMTVRDSRRQSTAVAFLKPAMSRANLHVLTDAPAQRLEFEGDRCVGVTYLHGGQPVTVRADREVIVCAGAIETPKLLMLSGIGDATELGSLGIPSRVNLPGVGQGLQDHLLGAGCNWIARKPVPTSHYNHSEVYMWERSLAGLPAPDMILLYVSLPFSTDQFTWDKTNGYSILSGVSRPHSRGWVKLASANPADPPRIDPNYLSVEEDWRSFVAATELAREIGNGRAYRDIRAREALPGNGVPRGDRQAMRDFLAKATHTYFHPTSTCRMGVDEKSVVDPQLRVHGTRGLRVADASIMPSITTGNTNAPSIMIGWKCAEMMLT